MSGLYEWITILSFGGQTMMRDPSTGSGQSASGLQYFLTDHLGSTVAITDSNGTLTSQQRYLPFGGTRTNVTTPNSLGTDFGYTGQRQLDEGMGGLMDYKARFYSPMLGRFVQPDTFIPDASNPQAWNRYSYANSNPIIYNDPTGHFFGIGNAVVIIGVALFVAAATFVIYETSPQFHDSVDYLSSSMAAGIDRALRRGSEKHENDLRVMESELTETGDVRGPKGNGEGCFSSVKNFTTCGVLFAFGIGTVVELIRTAGCDQSESNSRCPSPTNTPSKLKQSLTPTSTPSPTATSSQIPSPTSTSTRTSTPTSIPTLTSTPTQILTPSSTQTPFLSPANRRLLEMD